MGSIGLPELLVILLIVIIIFGASKLPQLGRGLGQGIRNFKESLDEGKSSGSKDKKDRDDEGDKA